MKSESLVTADQHAAVNTFPGLVHTARHTTEAGSARSRCPNPREGEGGADGRAGDWGEVVTRYPYRKVGMDHLLSKEKLDKSLSLGLGRKVCLPVAIQF